MSITSDRLISLREACELSDLKMSYFLRKAMAGNIDLYIPLPLGMHCYSISLHNASSYIPDPSINENEREMLERGSPFDHPSLKPDARILLVDMETCADLVRFGSAKQTIFKGVLPQNVHNTFDSLSDNNALDLTHHTSGLFAYYSVSEQYGQTIAHSIFKASPILIKSEDLLIHTYEIPEEVPTLHILKTQENQSGGNMLIEEAKNRMKILATRAPMLTALVKIAIEIWGKQFTARKHYPNNNEVANIIYDSIPNLSRTAADHFASIVRPESLGRKSIPTDESEIERNIHTISQKLTSLINFEATTLQENNSRTVEEITALARLQCGLNENEAKYVSQLLRSIPP